MFLKGEVYAAVLKLVLVLGIFFRTDGYARPTILTPPAVAIKSWKLRDRTPFRTTTLFHQTTPKITFDSIVSASDSQKIAHVPLSSTTVMPKASAILLSSSLISSLAMIARPVMAATKVSSSSVKVVAEKRLSFSNLIRNLLLGGASLGQLRVGDVRNNPYSLALNVLATLIFGFVPLVLLSVYVQRRFTNRYLSRMEKEIRREREYRENMYFEAVEGVLEKLKNPNLKPNEKKILLLDLKELDPKGKIRAYLSGKLDRRPDISDSLAPKKKK